MITNINSEDRLVQKTFAEHLDAAGTGVAPYTHVSWRDRIRASAGVGASLTPEDVLRFDEELAKLLALK